MWASPARSRSRSPTHSSSPWSASICRRSAQGSAPSASGFSPGAFSVPPVDSGDAAQVAALVRPLVDSLILLGLSLVPLLSGLALLAVAEADLFFDLSDHGN